MSARKILSALLEADAQTATGEIVTIALDDSNHLSVSKASDADRRAASEGDPDAYRLLSDFVRTKRTKIGFSQAMDIDQS
jgi:hypothetical protein